MILKKYFIIKSNIIFKHKIHVPAIFDIAPSYLVKFSEHKISFLQTGYLNSFKQL